MGQIILYQNCRRRIEWEKGGGQMKREPGGELASQLAVCVAAAVALVYAAEKICEGKKWPVWERWGPWIKANRIQAIAILAAVLYGAWTALGGDKNPKPEQPPEEEAFTPCG